MRILINLGLCRLLCVTVRQWRDTCFSSCNRPGACQTGRKSVLVCFRLRSSAGHLAWASPCMYLWYWSPGNENTGEGSNRKQKNSKVSNNSTVFNSFSSRSTYCLVSGQSPAFPVPSLKGLYKHSLLPQRRLLGDFIYMLVNSFYRITSCPVRHRVALSHSVTVLVGYLHVIKCVVISFTLPVLGDSLPCLISTPQLKIAPMCTELENVLSISSCWRHHHRAKTYPAFSFFPSLALLKSPPPFLSADHLSLLIPSASFPSLFLFHYNFSTASLTLPGLLPPQPMSRC